MLRPRGVEPAQRLRQVPTGSILASAAVALEGQREAAKGIAGAIGTILVVALAHTYAGWTAAAIERSRHSAKSILREEL